MSYLFFFFFFFINPDNRVRDFLISRGIPASAIRRKNDNSYEISDLSTGKVIAEFIEIADNESIEEAAVRYRDEKNGRRFLMKRVNDVEDLKSKEGAYKLYELDGNGKPVLVLDPQFGFGALLKDSASQPHQNASKQSWSLGLVTILVIVIALPGYLSFFVCSPCQQQVIKQCCPDTVYLADKKNILHELGMEVLKDQSTKAADSLLHSTAKKNKKDTLK